MIMIVFKVRLVLRIAFSLSMKLMLLLLGLSMASMPVFAKDEPIGFVIVARGAVYAVDPSEIERKLKRRSKIFVGDTVSTAKSAKAQIKFIDGSIIAIREDSSLRVDDFVYNPGGDEKNFFTLLKGGFRAISGSIGKKNRDDYRVSTPLATIGIRGTVYDAVLGDQLVMGVWKGGIKVENEGGVIELGVGAEYNYCVVNNAGEAPVGVLEAPEVLMNSASSRKKDSEDEDKQEKDEEESPEEDEEVGGEESDEERKEKGDRKEESERDNENAQREEQPGDEASEDQVVDGDRPPRHEGRGGDDDLDDNAEGQPPGKREINFLGGIGEPGDEDNVLGELLKGNFGEGDDNIFSGGVNLGDEHHRVWDNPEVNPFPEGFPIVEIEPEDIFQLNEGQPPPQPSGAGGGIDYAINPDILSPEEIDAVTHFGIAVIDREPGLQNAAGEYVALFSGSASNGVDGEPVFLDNDIPPTNSEYSSVVPDFILKSSGGTFQILGNVDSTRQPGSVTFGMWDDGGSIATLFSDMEVSVTGENIVDPVYWLTAMPMQSGALGELTGTVNYNILDFYRGSASSGELLNMMMTVKVDFSSGEDFLNGFLMLDTGFYPESGDFIGDMFVDENVDFWDIFFTGSVVDGVLLVDLDSESSRNGAGGVEGDITGLITGQGNGYLAGGFKLWQVDGSGTEWVSGVFGLSQGDDRISAAERGVIDTEGRIGLYTIASTDNGMGFGIMGGLSDSNSNSPKILGMHSAPGDAELSLSAIDTVINPRHEATRDVAHVVALDNSIYYNEVVLPEGFNYGVWNGDVNPIEIQKNATDVNDTYMINAPIYWLTTPKADSDALMAKTGTVIYSNLVFLDGESSAGPLIGLSSKMELGVDFSTMEIIGGHVELWHGDSDNQQVWVVGDLQGEIGPQGFISMYPGDGYVDTFTCINFSDCDPSDAAFVEMGAVFSGSDLSTISGVYKFTSFVDPTQYASGIFSLYNETRFTQSLDLFTGDAFFVMQGDIASGFGSGFDEDLKVYNAIAYRQHVADGALDELILRGHDSSAFGYVMKIGSATVQNDDHNSISVGSRVDWGMWDASVGSPSDALQNPGNATDKTPLNVPSYWIVGTSTDPDVVQSLTGSFNYNVMEGFAGSIVGVAMDSMGVDVSVDFTNATFSGNLNATASVNTVNVGFSGSLSGSYLDFDFASGTVNSQSAGVDISATLVGDSAQGIIGGFKATEFADTANTSEGVFFVTQ